MGELVRSLLSTRPPKSLTNMIVLGTISMKFFLTMSKYDSMRLLMISVSMRSLSEGESAGRRIVSGTCGSFTTVSCCAWPRGRWARQLRVGDILLVGVLLCVGGYACMGSAYAYMRVCVR